MSAPGPAVVIGLTGGIASGKSAVADLLAARGAVVIDADLLARAAVAPGSPGLAAVVARFGPSVLGTHGELDRAALGRLVFAEPAARRDLEAIVHPAVRARAAELTAAAPDGSVVVQVIPLLVETGQQDAFDIVAVVDVDPSVQVARVRERDGLDVAAATDRLNAQAPRAARLAAADWVIHNAGSLADLAAEVDRFWESCVLPGLRTKP